MPNFPGEHEIRVFYTVSPAGQAAFEHRLTFDVKIDVDHDPGTDLSDIDITLRNGTNAILSTYVISFMFVIYELYHASVTFNRFELWKYPPDSYDATFIGATVLAENGTNATAPISAHYSMMTWRTAGGGVMKMQFMEDSSSGDNQIALPTGSALFDDINSAVLALDSGIVGQDDTFPIVGLKVSKGQSEAIWKRRNRPR
jgi:hypothetical protein